MKPQEFPRVLFITGCAFNHKTGGGVTFGNLFAQWPKDRLATVTDDPVPVSTDVCEKYFFLSGKERSYIWPFGFLNKKKGAGHQTVLPAKNISTVRRILKSIVGPAGIPDRGRLTPDLMAWIESFKPEVIYTILGTSGYVELVDQVQQTYKLPVVVHLMDDGVTDPRHPGLFGGYIRRRYRKLFHSLLARAQGRMAICEEMALEYKQRFGFDFGHFQNPVEMDRWEPYFKKSMDMGHDIRIVFSGSILPFAQSGALKKCAVAVNELVEEGVPVKLEIYTPLAMLSQDDRLALSGPGIILRDALEDDQAFFAKLGQSDLLLLPVNFDDASVHYIRLSMPTRVPAYLASGTPILVVGPRGVAQVDYALRKGWGHVVSIPKIENIKSGILEMIRSRDKRQLLSDTAKRVARENHDAVNVRTGFRAALVSVCQQ